MSPTVKECRILFSDIVYVLVLILKTGKSFVLLNIPIIHTQHYWLNQWFEFGGAELTILLTNGRQRESSGNFFLVMLTVWKSV